MAREVAVSWLGEMKTEVRIGPHRLVADEPVDRGGDDAGPTPVDLVLAALGA
jgi:putative redox protein